MTLEIKQSTTENNNGVKLDEVQNTSDITS